jgi:hypothetical protein
MGWKQTSTDQIRARRATSTSVKAHSGCVLAAISKISRSSSGGRMGKTIFGLYRTLKMERNGFITTTIQTESKACLGYGCDGTYACTRRVSEASIILLAGVCINHRGSIS